MFKRAVGGRLAQEHFTCFTTDFCTRRFRPQMHHITADNRRLAVSAGAGRAFVRQADATAQTDVKKAFALLRRESREFAFPIRYANGNHVVTTTSLPSTSTS